MIIKMRYKPFGMGCSEVPSRIAKSEDLIDSHLEVLEAGFKLTLTLIISYRCGRVRRRYDCRKFGKGRHRRF